MDGSCPSTDSFDTVATTLRDLQPLLRTFREPFDADVRRLVDANWSAIVQELAGHAPNEDLVVMLSDARESWPPRALPYMMHTVVARATAGALSLVTDVRIADWLHRPRTSGGTARTIDVVVEIGGKLTALELELIPRVDLSRSFELFHPSRSRSIRYVFLDSGEAVATLSTLASVLDLEPADLDELLARAPESLVWTTLARVGPIDVHCVRIDRVEPFLRAIAEQL